MRENYCVELIFLYILNVYMFLLIVIVRLLIMYFDSCLKVKVKLLKSHLYNEFRVYLYLDAWGKKNK